MKLIQQQRTIVIIGNFNPSIINPDWLFHHKFITRSDLKQKDIELINKEFSIFSIPDIHIFVSWEKMQITSKRYEVSELIFDLCINIMSLLSHTPVKMLGINELNIYRLSSLEERNNLGFKLVPAEIWKEPLKTFEGMSFLRVQAKRDDGNSGYKRIEVDPSLTDECAVNFNFNDHYEITGGSDQLCKVISLKREPTDFFNKICESVIKYGG